MSRTGVQWNGAGQLVQCSVQSSNQWLAVPAALTPTLVRSCALRAKGMHARWREAILVQRREHDEPRGWSMEWRTATGPGFIQSKNQWLTVPADGCVRGARGGAATAPLRSSAHQASSLAFHSQGIASGDSRCARDHPSQWHVHMVSAFVYIVTNRHNTTLYVGMTTDLNVRTRKHRDKFYPKSFTARYNVNKLVYYEVFDSVPAARAREKQLKAGSRNKKLVLINRYNPDWKDLFDIICEASWNGTPLVTKTE